MSKSYNGRTARGAKLRSIRRDEADKRQIKYDSLNLVEKLSLVESRGGSVRELTRIKKQLAVEAAKPVKKPAVKVVPVEVAPVVAEVIEVKPSKKVRKKKAA